MKLFIDHYQAKLVWVHIEKDHCYIWRKIFFSLINFNVGSGLAPNSKIFALMCIWVWRYWIMWKWKNVSTKIKKSVMLSHWSHCITSWNYFWSLSVLINQQPTPSPSPTRAPRRGWNIEGNLLAKSPSAAVIPMTLDVQINMSGSLSNSGNNVGLICDDKRICSIENQWEVASATRYRLCLFPSNLKHIVALATNSSLGKVPFSSLIELP